MRTHVDELEAGERFAFGANWQGFLRHLNELEITHAEEHLVTMLSDLRDKTFLDIGCGSGLSSIAAHRLGAKIRAFDYDAQSVACARELQRLFEVSWQVEEGSALDESYMRSLGEYDIVYSWGVLHHTGQMWKAIDLAAERVKLGGFFNLAIYNDQGWKSRGWRAVKAAYNRYRVIRPALTILYAVPMTAARWSVRAATGRLQSERGMSLWYDAIDWLGGYPFEVASFAAVVEHVERLGFDLERSVNLGSRSGCNEYVFRRPLTDSPS